MPSKPYWLQRLPEITQEVRTMQVSTIDRKTFEAIFRLRRRRAIELMHYLGSHRNGRGFMLERGALLEKLESFEVAVQHVWFQARSSRTTGRPEVNDVARSNGHHKGLGEVVIRFADDGELTEKLLAELRAVFERQHVPDQRDDFARSKPQYDRFEQAVKAFGEQRFREAQASFAQACAGPNEKIRTSAEKYLRVCNTRLAQAFEAKSFEEHYAYGVALLNARDLIAAHKHFELALQVNPGADYIYASSAESVGDWRDYGRDC
jgi:tetratricopeptide (TPR) repeat protein